jgi:hypothetical protein
MAKLTFTSKETKVISVDVSNKMHDLLEDAKARLLATGEVKADRVNETLLAELHENIEEHKTKTSYIEGKTITIFDVSAKELKNALKHI